MGRRKHDYSGPAVHRPSGPRSSAHHPAAKPSPTLETLRRKDRPGGRRLANAGTRWSLACSTPPSHAPTGRAWIRNPHPGPRRCAALRRRGGAREGPWRYPRPVGELALWEIAVTAPLRRGGGSWRVEGGLGGTPVSSASTLGRAERWHSRWQRARSGCYFETSRGSSAGRTKIA